MLPRFERNTVVVKRDRNIQKRTREYQKFSPSLVRKNSNTNTNSIKVGLSEKKVVVTAP